MAQKPKRRRRMGRYIRGAIDEKIDVGTLAANTAVLSALSLVDERTLMSSIETAWSISDWTGAAGVGPVLVGVAHSDYSLAEVEEFLEAANTWDEGDLIAQEISKRKIRRIGIIVHNGLASPNPVMTLNDGMPVKTKLNWILNQGQTVNLFVYNMGESAFATTDPDARIIGHANLFPK